MAIEVGEFEAPAYWASAVINGDYSGLDTVEAAQVEAWLTGLKADGWSIVSTRSDESGEAEESHFRNHPPFGAPAEWLGGDYLHYTALRGSN